MPQRRKAFASVLCLMLGSLLTGCGLETTAVSPSEVVAGTTISGAVHGGSQPIFGAKVYLLAVNPTVYAGPGIAASSGNASVSLLTAAGTGNAADSIGSYVVTNSSNGGFSLSGTGYNCAGGYAQGTGTAVSLTGSEQVYLYVLGGTQPNLTSANSSSGLLVALGSCSSPSSQVTVNEITTVATAYAFAGYATDATHIGGSNTSLAFRGLRNASYNVANLTNVADGSATASSTGITPPTAAVITIADALASCVNGITNNSHCQTLFQYTQSAGASGTAPTDTATAAINLAHNPYPTAAGVTAIYGLVSGTGAPFSGGLTGKPNDFTLGILLTGGGLKAPIAIAIDAVDDAWIANYSGNSLTEFTGAGAAQSTSAGYTGGGLSSPGGIGIDTNVWVSNQGSNVISRFLTGGSAVSSTGYSGGGLNSPNGIAIDSSGNIWTTSGNNNNLNEFSNAGVAMSGTNGYTGGGLNFPLNLAIDSSGYVWAVNYNGNSLSKFTTGGSVVSTNAYTGGNLMLPQSLAIDGPGDVWIASPSNSGNIVNPGTTGLLSEFSSAGVAQSNSPISQTGGLYNPQGVAIDGAGNVWTTNYSTGSTNYNSLSEFSSAGAAISGSTGYTAGGSVSSPYAIAIDGSGDVWATNYINNSVVELVGAASPVATPVVANLRSPYGGATVNRP